jgi:hypothetical protein
MNNMDPREIAAPTPRAEKTCFFTLVIGAQQERNARLLVDSLRAFGGPMSDCPVWVFYPDLATARKETWQNVEHVHLLPLGDIHTPRYWFSLKVHVGARAEELAGPEAQTLVWLAPENLIVQPPLLFDLAAAPDAPLSKAAFRTVHHSNVGSPAGQPLDAFWAAVYRSVGLDEAPYTTRSYIDDRELRPYWNTHCFAIDRALGLLQAWREGFRTLVDDAYFQAGPCHDVAHQVFLHQAVLCALLTRELVREQIRALPPEYSYPLHMHDQVPSAFRAATLNELVCAVYEDVLPLEGLAVHEPLRSWLKGRTG